MLGSVARSLVAALCSGPLGPGLLCVSLIVTGCGDDELRAQRLIEHSFLDSVATHLQNLRALDKDIDRFVMTDTVSSVEIVPLITERFRPVVAGLHGRVTALETTPKVAPARESLLQYLELRLEAYDAAIAGLAEDRAELFDVFSRKQREADLLGRAMEQQIREIMTQVPGYSP